MREPPKKVLEYQSSKSQKILIPAPEVSLKKNPKNFHGGQIAEHMVWTYDQINIWSDKLILQIVRGGTI